MSSSSDGTGVMGAGAVPAARATMPGNTRSWNCRTRASPGQAVPPSDHCGKSRWYPYPGSSQLRQIRSGIPCSRCSHTPSSISAATCAFVHGSVCWRLDADSHDTAPVPSGRRLACMFASARVCVPMYWPRLPSKPRPKCDSRFVESRQYSKIRCGVHGAAMLCTMNCVGTMAAWPSDSGWSSMRRAPGYQAKGASSGDRPPSRTGSNSGLP